MSKKSKFTSYQVHQFEVTFNGWVALLAKDMLNSKKAQMEVMREFEGIHPPDIDCTDFARQSFLHHLGKFYNAEKEEYENMGNLIKEAQDILNNEIED